MKQFLPTLLLDVRPKNENDNLKKETPQAGRFFFILEIGDNEKLNGELLMHS